MIGTIYLIVLFLCSLICLYHYKVLAKYLRYFTLMLFTTLLVESVAVFLIRNNAWLFNIYTCFEFIFYFLLFRFHIENEKFKNTTLYFIAIFLLVALTNILFFQGINLFNNYTHSLGSVLIVTCSVAFYRQSLNSANPQPLLHVPMFWISTGLLMYYTCSFFFYGLFHYIISVDMSVALKLYRIVQVLNIIMYLLFTFGIVSSTMHRKQSL